MPLRRHLLLCASAPLFVRHARAADVPRFELGVASGQPRPDGMVLWTRVTGPDLPDTVDVQWELAHDEAFTRIAARGHETAEAAWAHSVHAEPAGLAPGRWYWYRFRALGQPSRVGRTRTAPAPDATATLRLAIASCQRWDHGHYAAWRHMATQDLDCVAFLGDYIYEYPSPPLALRRHSGGLLRSLAQYRARYAQYKQDPALQDAHAAFPWLVVWDDHELENDYAGSTALTPLGADMATLKAAAYQACWEHQPFAKAQRPRGAEMRIVGRLDWGRLARLHLLDDRQYRVQQACPPLPRLRGAGSTTPADCPELLDPARSLLGPEQEQWLADGWSLDRRWNLVCQQTLMTRWHTRADGRVSSDGWNGYPASRQRLLAGVAARRVPGTVVLGGDVHASVVADLKVDFDDTQAPVVASEFCGTSISSRGREQKDLDAARRLNPQVHWARSDQRGYTALTFDERHCRARLMAVHDVQDPDSTVSEVARFAVAQGRPGPQRE